MPAIDWRAKSLFICSLFIVSALNLVAPAAAQDATDAVTSGTPPPPEASDEPTEPASPCAPPPPVEDTEEPPGEELIFVAGRCISAAELNRLLDGYESAVAQETAALAQLRDTVGIVSELQRAVEAAEVSLAEVTQRLAAANAEVVRARDREQLALDELAAVTEMLSEERQRLRDQAVAAYITGSAAREAVLDRKLDLENANDFATIRTYGRVLVETQNDQVDLVEQLQLAASRLEVELESARSLDSAARSALVDISETAEEIDRELTRLVDGANAAAAEQGLQLVSIQMRRDEFAARLGVVPPPSGRLAAVLSASGSRLSGASSGVATRLRSPLQSTGIASLFGPRLHPIFNEVRPHTGIDLEATAGSPIFAAAAGEVVVADDEGGYGRTVAIDHGGGIITLYAHQSALGVVVGENVEAGDLIGFVGSTGYSTGPHLHLEVRVDGRAVDPLPLIDLSDTGSVGAATSDSGG